MTISAGKGLALVVGSTGIVGRALVAHLVRHHWSVVGLSRKPEKIDHVEPLSIDLLDARAVKAAVKDRDISHVYFCTWSRQATEAENIQVGAMLRNLLAALGASKSLQHFAPVTGTRRYLGPFESGVQTSAETPFREDSPRLPTEHFYYVWEDMLLDAAARQGFHWNVHRPQPIIGFAVGNAMNTAATLAVYASICREMNRPFLFPGSQFHWDALADVSDSRQIARQLEWAALTPEVDRLATWWFADWDLGRQSVAITDMTRSRRLGFSGYQETVPPSFTFLT